MNNFENVWGNTNKDWCKIDVKEKQFLAGFTALAWVGMISFFVCCALAVETKSQGWAGAALVSLFIWLAGGYPAIRIIRSRKKAFILPK